MKTLDQRLLAWGIATHNWTGGFVLAHEGAGLGFRVGPVTGYGHTTNEAVNNCADGLLEEGWPDDRGPQCDRCERYAETSYFPEYGAEFCADCGADPTAAASRDSQQTETES